MGVHLIMDHIFGSFCHHYVLLIEKSAKAKQGKQPGKKKERLLLCLYLVYLPPHHPQSINQSLT
jgi:hypothetical protein